METFCRNNCNVCGSSNYKKKFEFSYTSNYVLEKLDIEESPNTYIMICIDCGHNYAYPQLHHSLLAKYYEVLNSEFFDLDKLPKTDVLFKEHAKVRNLVEQNTTNGNILEVGSGYGFLVNGFDTKKWNKYAVEPSPHASRYLRENSKVNIQNTTFENAIFKDNYFDVIVLFDVIEHIQNPQFFFNRIKEILKPDGYVYIGTGNIESLNAKIAQKHWAYFGSWEHISFFTKKSIKFLLSSNDMKLVKIVKRPYKIGFHNYSSFFKNIVKCFLKLFSSEPRVNVLTNDHVTIIAKKIEH
ncbi:class I SAM-dependent methyltransferase [Winogradskyella sp. PE311]|uniref:class I SAM-dependent methyltransferase n=1 Tax=Winogradskyella sp. PE311 TaxID=3366943 RepID=UPI003980311D